MRRALLPASLAAFHQSDLDSRLAEEEAAFEAMRAALWERFPNQYVAIQGGVVVDQDAAYMTLVERMRERYPDDVAVLIEQVLPEPPPELQLRSALWRQSRDEEL